MAFIYQKARDRVNELRNADLGELNDCSQELKLVHHDRAKLEYPSCYFELMSFPDPNNKSKQVNCVVIIPEHHAPNYYDLEDLSELVETTYKNGKAKKIDLLKKQKRSQKKNAK